MNKFRAFLFMETDLRFRKEERLRSKVLISELFEKGSSFYCYPFKIYWKESTIDCPYPAQLAVSVSKRSFKKAVSRNRIKRQLREAWRHNKHKLYSHLEQVNRSIVIMIVYTPGEMPQSAFISKKMVEVVSELLLILPGNTSGVE